MTPLQIIQSVPAVRPGTIRKSPAATGPLNHLGEEEIRHILRGFPASSVAGAIGLRTGTATPDFEACLFGILFFYRPAGTAGPASESSGETRLREDLGLDSLSMAEAMFKIEELFEIGIDNGELAKTETIADARRLLELKLQVQRPAEP